MEPWFSQTKSASDGDVPDVAYALSFIVSLSSGASASVANHRFPFRATVGAGEDFPRLDAKQVYHKLFLVAGGRLLLEGEITARIGRGQAR